MKWIEGSIISYLYDGIPLETLVGRVHHVRVEYGVASEEIMTLIKSIEDKYVTYFGGRFRLAFAVIGKKPTVASFRQQRERAKLIDSLLVAISKT